MTRKWRLIQWKPAERPHIIYSNCVTTATANLFNKVPFSFESIQFIRLFVWPSFELKFARNRSVVVASSAGRHFPVKSIRESSRISWNPFRCPSFRLHHKVAGHFLDKVLFFHFSNFSKCWLFNRLSSRKQKNVRKIRAALRRAVPQRLSFQNQLNR